MHFHESTSHRPFGWLIYNGGLRAPKYMALNKLYSDTAASLGIELSLIANDEIHCFLTEQTASAIYQPDAMNVPVSRKPDFVLFLDKDIRLAKQLESLGFRLFNPRETIENCDDKILTFQQLSGKGILMPKTLFSPMYFPGTDAKETSLNFVSLIEKEFTYPLIIKEAFGSFGAQVYLIHNREELIQKREELKYIPHLYQEFIASSMGQDVRIYVVGGQVVAAMHRFSDTDFRANVSNGAQMEPYTPSPDFCEMAILASDLLKADFTGVDLLFGPNGEPVLCEVNSNAHIKNILDCTGINVASFIFKHILKVIYHV